MAGRAITLVLGGARSGKSVYAERLVDQSDLAPVYLATARAGDEEMALRIAQHRTRRGANWITIEEPVELAVRLAETSTAKNAILVDCLTLWLSNLYGMKCDIEAEIEDLATALRTVSGPVVLVSNELGLGLVPENALARAFRDHHGRMNQRVAQLADHVVFMVAGLPTDLK